MTQEQKDWIQSLDLREMLDVIDLYLSIGHHSSTLWDVLTALRGPDSGDEGLKETTTEVIRSVAFPLVKAEGATPANFSNLDASLLRKAINTLKQEDTAKSSHFDCHVLWAAQALSQTLTKENP